jgi:hypothetical protein
VDTLIFGLPHRGQYFLEGFRRFIAFSKSPMSRNSFILALHPASCQLLPRDVFCRIPQFDKVFADSVTVVSLKYYLTVLRCSSAGAETFQALGQSCEVRALVIYAIHYGRWFAKFTSFKPYANPLLLLLDITASAQIFRKSACWTDFSHYPQPV